MTTDKLLAAAVLAIAIGAPIAVFVGDINRAQPMTVPRGTGSVPARVPHEPNGQSIRVGFA